MTDKISDKFPNIIERGTVTKLPTEKKESIKEAQAWSEATLKSDQKWRKDETINLEREKLQNEFKRLNINLEQYEVFLASAPKTEDEKNLKIRLEKFLEKIKAVGKDEDNQTSLKLLLEKIDGFPSISEYGKDVSRTAWIVLQHADNDREFQRKGLKLMYECRKQRPDEPSVELTRFYYLTDRITTALYGYQYFGTQNKGINLVSLPENLKSNFAQNPALFCMQLVENELPEELRTTPSNEDMFDLWSLAAQDSRKFGIENLQANANIAEYRNKESN